jgi:predicted  nucleic acid-binding Zn-ribbon protein
MRTDLQCPNCGWQHILYHPEDTEHREFYACEGCLIDIETEDELSWLTWHNDDNTYRDAYTGKEILFVDVHTGEKALREL